MLEALVQIRIWLQLTNKCRSTPIPKMYELFASGIYNLHNPQYISEQSISINNNNDELFEKTLILMAVDDNNENCTCFILNVNQN